MVKGIKKEIFFLSDLGDIGNGIFECAYFIIRSDEEVSAVCDNDIIAEAERIVLLAEKSRFAYKAMPDGKEYSKKERPAKPERKKSISMLFVGISLGLLISVITALIYFFVLR